MGPFGVLLLGTVAGFVIRPYVDKTIAEAVKKAHAEAMEEKSKAQA